MLKMRRNDVVRLARNWSGPLGAAPGAPCRRAIDIEALLAWAYRDELPKAAASDHCALGPAAPRSGWQGVSSYGALLARVACNAYGVIPFDQGGEPCADAVRVAAAVASLDACALELPDDWSPLADLGDLGPEGAACCVRALDRVSLIDRDGARRLKASPRRFVEKHAILGGCPDWRAETPALEPVRDIDTGRALWFVKRRFSSDGAFGEVGEEVEMVVSVNSSTSRPPADAYRKFRLEPDPTDAAVARAEYEVWRAALDVLVADLDGALERFDVLPSPRAWRPWEEGEPALGRVLPDLASAIRPDAPHAPWAVGEAPRRGALRKLRRAS